MLYDKRTLYTLIEAKISQLNASTELPFDLHRLIKKENLQLSFISFESDAIGAILYKDIVSGILINSNKSNFEQRFDLAHELIHFWFHPSPLPFYFQKPQLRDRTREWEANEGAAELLLPYKDFIPRFVKTARYIEENYEPLEEIYNELAHFYKVMPIVIDYRIRNLESEILQYISGIPIDKITLNKSYIRFNKNKIPVVYRSLIHKVI